jgi:ActR/RegA family two-component response regulator
MASDLSVAVIDEDAQLRSQLSRLCRDEGWPLATFRTVVDLAAARPSEQRSVVVVEPCLPGSTWYRHLRAICASHQGGRLVVATSSPSAAMMAEAKQLGVAAFLAKPLQRELLKGAILGTSRDWAPPESAALHLVEWEHINKVLRSMKGNMVHTSRVLRISRQGLYEKLNKRPSWHAA